MSIDCWMSIEFWMSIEGFKVAVPNGIFGTFNFKAKNFSNQGLN
jgi:hypothetical protein